MIEPGACVGSGYCCKKAPCGLALSKHGLNTSLYWGEGKPGCPDLVWDETSQRHWCGLVLNAKSEKERRWVVDILAIGAGCCSSLNSTRQGILRRLASSSSSSDISLPGKARTQ